MAGAIRRRRKLATFPHDMRDVLTKPNNFIELMLIEHILTAETYQSILQ
jgi:hypothetical protein